MNEFLNHTTRIAAYPRVSTEEQRRKGLSIEAQTESLKKWAASQGVKVADFYNDAGHSARKRYSQRPEMTRLLNDVQAGRIDLIIFTKLDRWFRSIPEYYKVQEILEQHNVQWKAIHEDYDTTTASGRLKINIMLSVAQDEADRDSERIKAVFESKRDRMEPVTGCVPTGYIVRDKKMLKDDAWAPVLDTFFSAFLRYQSIGQTRGEVMDRHGVEISYQNADLFLKKTAYCGIFNGVDGMCPAYITKAQFDTIQKLRKRTARKTTHNRTYLFSGLLRCGTCENRMASATRAYYRSDGSKSETFNYKCSGRYARSNCDNSVNIRESVIERYLLDNVDAALDAYALHVETAHSVAKPKLPQKRAAIKKKLGKLKDLYVNDLIDLDLYRKDYEALTAELAATEPPPKPDIVHLEALRNSFHAEWQEVYAGLSIKAKQQFWRRTLEKIVIHGDRSISFHFLSVFVD